MTESKYFHESRWAAHVHWYPALPTATKVCCESLLASFDWVVDLDCGTSLAPRSYAFLALIPTPHILVPLLSTQPSALRSSQRGSSLQRQNTSRSFMWLRRTISRTLTYGGWEAARFAAKFFKAEHDIPELQQQLDEHCAVRDHLYSHQKAIPTELDLLMLELWNIVLGRGLCNKSRCFQPP